MSALVKQEAEGGNSVGGAAMTNVNGVYGWKNIALGGKRGTVSGVLKMNKDGIAWRSKGGQSVTMVGADLVAAAWTRLNARLFSLRLGVKGGSVYKFDGFSAADGDFLKRFLLESFDVALEEEKTSVRGWNWGEATVREQQLSFSVADERAWELPLSEVLKGSIAGKGHELSLELHQDDTLANEAQDALVELKLYVGKRGEDGLKVAQERAQSLLDAVLAKAAPVSANNAALVTFEDVPVLVPRGRFEIELGASAMRLHGKTVHDYKIQYSSIVRLFQLPKPDQSTMLFVLSLEPPIRQGHTTYPHIVMQLPENEDTQLQVTLPPGAEQDERLQRLAAIESGPTFQVLARVFKALTDKRITVPKSFKSKEGARAVKCSFKANEGYLYPLERSLFFVHKPPTYIRFEEIRDTELLRVSSDTSNRTFDLAVNLRGGQGQVQFKGIAREEYALLFQFLQDKQLRIVNLDALHAAAAAPLGAAAALGGDDSDDEDNDFTEQQAKLDDEDDEDDDEDEEAEGADEEDGKAAKSEEGSLKRARETRSTRSRRGDGEKLEALEINSDYDEASEIGDGEDGGSEDDEGEESEEAEEPPKKKVKTEPKAEVKKEKSEEDDGADFDD